MVNRHPQSELLLEYCSGSLALAPSIAVTTHLQFCEHCGGAVKSLERIGGDFLDQTEAVPVSDDLFGKVLQGIEQDAGDSGSAITTPALTQKVAIDEIAQSLPQYVQKLLPQGELAWGYLSPSLRIANVGVGDDNHELAIHRIKAGGKAPQHSHRGQEITVVLTGTFSDEGGIYQPGDFVVREQGDVHRPIASQNEDCICLSVLAAPIKLTGVKRLFNPFLSFSPS
jgi:putative transcriptional regulator